MIIKHLLRSLHVMFYQTSPLMQLHQTASFLSFFPSIKAMYLCTIRSWQTTHVSYDLAGPFMYNINLGATTTTSLSIRGVIIPIDLVISTTGLFMVNHSSIKPVPLAYSDLKSEFLCQSSQHCHRTYRPPEPPRTPGISPTPSQPCIIHITQNQVLSPSTSKTSCTSNEPSTLIAATLLKLSRMFSSNITLHHFSTQCCRDYIQ